MTICQIHIGMICALDKSKSYMHEGIFGKATLVFGMLLQWGVLLA